MEILQATINELEIVKDIVYQTIQTIYPKYYPKGAVEFFLSHHNDHNIILDLEEGIVYLIKEEELFIGTITIKKNEICRLFVYPQYQHQGYGKALLDFGEKKIYEKYSIIQLDASLPAKGIYLKRGYKDITYHQIVTDQGDVLCYDVMQKRKFKKNRYIPQADIEMMREDQYEGSMYRE